jgi:hypothetical protein
MEDEDIFYKLARMGKEAWMESEKGEDVRE